MTYDFYADVYDCKGDVYFNKKFVMYSFWKERNINLQNLMLDCWEDFGKLYSKLDFIK